MEKRPQGEKGNAEISCPVEQLVMLVNVRRCCSRLVHAWHLALIRATSKENGMVNIGQTYEHKILGARSGMFIMWSFLGGCLGISYVKSQLKLVCHKNDPQRGLLPGRCYGCPDTPVYYQKSELHDPGLSASKIVGSMRPHARGLSGDDVRTMVA